MTNALNLTFDEGAPLDATKLQQLVTYLNEVNTNALRVPDVSGLTNKAIAQRMVAGKASLGNLTIANVPVAYDITFDYPLTGDPASIQVTLETSTNDADLVYHIASGSSKSTGFKLYISRVAGLTTKGAVAAGAKSFGAVAVHYFAIAKPSVV